MTRTELRNFVKDKFKAMDFQSSKSYLYKIFDDDYLIGFYLNPTGRSKGYYFTCGIIYLPDENKMPIRGIFDLQWDFIFPWEESDTINISECIEKKRYRIVFEYEKYTLAQLENFFDSNFEYFMKPLFNKSYGLDIFRSDWRYMKRFSVQSVEKLCRRAGLNSKDVLMFLGKD